MSLSGTTAGRDHEVRFLDNDCSRASMSKTVRKTISLPKDLVREVEAAARAGGKTFSSIIRDALRSARTQRRLQDFKCIQTYWSRIARDRGILSERDLARHPRS